MDKTTVRIETIFKPLYAELGRKKKFLEMSGVDSLEAPAIRDHVLETEWERIKENASEYQIPPNMHMSYNFNKFEVSKMSYIKKCYCCNITSYIAFICDFLYSSQYYLNVSIVRRLKAHIQ
jgi:hypothetical protein